MFVFQQPILVCFILLSLSQLTSSLTCYSCSPCNDPFKANNIQQVTVPDNGSYSCAKYWTAEQNVIRDALLDCIPNDVVGIGEFCCLTDLCNKSNNIKSIGSIIFTLGIVIILINI